MADFVSVTSFFLSRYMKIQDWLPRQH